MFFRGYIVCETEHFDRRLAYMFLTPKRQNDWSKTNELRWTVTFIMSRLFPEERSSFACKYIQHVYVNYLT